MKLKDDAINKWLQQMYNKNIEKYAKNHVFGIFVTGLGCYGFAESEKELHATLIYLPTFEELCVHKPKVTEVDKHLTIIDIRMLYRMGVNCDLNTLELLCTPYKIINEDYETIFQKMFLDKKEIYAHYNPRLRLLNVSEKILDGSVSNFDAYRLSIAAKLYYAYSCPIEKCFILGAEDSPFADTLWEIKKTNKSINRKELANDIHQVVYNTKYEEDPDAEDLLQEGIIKIIRTSLAEKVDIKAFEKDLTKMEKEAYEIIKKMAVDGSVTVSTTQLISDTKISRPIWRNLFNKIKGERVATVTNMGVKGTKIDFLIKI